MVEIIAQMAAGAAPMPAAAQPPTQPGNMNPAETKTFSLMMDGGATNVATPATASTPEVSAVQKAIATQGTEFHDRFHSLDVKRQALLETDMTDPMMTMWKSVDFSFESTTLFTHLNLASGLATAVSNSFNSLFKNQS